MGVTVLTAAIVGPGNIGTDLMYKLLRSPSVIEPRWMVGVDPASEGLALARRRSGVEATTRASTGCSSRTELPRHRLRGDLGRTCTAANAPALRRGRHPRVDLTPAAVGPVVIPPVNGDAHLDADERQHGHLRRAGDDPDGRRGLARGPVPYAEIVASVASRSAGPGTRANIDEFTRTTAHGVEAVGGAERGKAIIILNPAEPPMIMRDTIFCAVAAATPTATRSRLGRARW